MNNKEQKAETTTEPAIVGNTVLNAAAIDCIIKELNILQKYRNGVKVTNLKDNTGHLLFRDVIKTLKRLGGCI